MDDSDEDVDWFAATPANATAKPARRGRGQSPPEYIDCPFTVVIDSREQSNWDFKSFRADARHKRLPLVVRTVIKGLKSGDYSIEGMEDRISVERKSLEDLYSTLGQGRDRFIRELERLNDMECAAVVIEADWRAIIENPPKHSRLLPKTVFRSINTWEQEFPRIHWHTMWSREMAERKCFRVLERFWIREQRRLKGINVRNDTKQPTDAFSAAKWLSKNTNFIQAESSNGPDWRGLFTCRLEVSYSVSGRVDREGDGASIAEAANAAAEKVYAAIHGTGP